MVTWDIYDYSGEWLGTSNGFTEAEAISNAKAQGMDGAVKAVPCED